MKQGPRRQAIVTSGESMADLRRSVAAYLPGNYRIIRALSRDDPHLRNLYVPERSSSVLIGGHDVAGWTLDGYVIPRLRSGLRFATEVMPTGRSRKMSVAQGGGGWKGIAVRSAAIRTGKWPKTTKVGLPKAGRARRSGNHSHPAHPYSHPIATHHRRK